MTATALADVRRPREAAPPITLSRVTTVELRKMFDTRSGFWLMSSIFITALLAAVRVIAFAPDRQLTYLTFAKTIGFPMADQLSGLGGAFEVGKVTGPSASRSG